MAPKRYGKWITMGSLSEGGQARTFLVYSEGDEEKKPFVLKRLKNVNRIERFRHELDAVRKLSHPNVLQVVGADLEHASPYIVTEYCSGGSLSKRDLTQYTVLERLRMFAAISQGVSHAHENDIIHRDLKPDNIFLRDHMTPVVGDFGLCFLTEEGERVTPSDEAVGSRFYTAPELEAGRVETVRPAADVYSLGKILYWMMAQRHLPREDFRAPEFDLTRRYPNHVEYFLINDLLERMIVVDLAVRYENAFEVTWSTEQLIKRIEARGHSTDPAAPQPCTYCGTGSYRILVDDINDINKVQGEQIGQTVIQRMGLNLHKPWLILICDYCGNVQLFRPDFAKTQGAWRKR